MDGCELGPQVAVQRIGLGDFLKQFQSFNVLLSFYEKIT